MIPSTIRYDHWSFLHEKVGAHVQFCAQELYRIYGYISRESRAWRDHNVAQQSKSNDPYNGRANALDETCQDHNRIIRCFHEHNDESDQSQQSPKEGRLSRLVFLWKPSDYGRCYMIWWDSADMSPSSITLQITRPSDYTYIIRTNSFINVHKLTYANNSQAVKAETEW